MVATMTVNVEELRRQAPLGFTLATEVADWLAVRGVPFKEAHEITGALVQACEKHGIELWEASPALLAEMIHLRRAQEQHTRLVAALVGVLALAIGVAIWALTR